MMRKLLIAAAAMVAVAAVAGFSQTNDTAYVPVIVNRAATVSFELPANAPTGARVPSGSRNQAMDANRARTFVLILGPAGSSSISHSAPRQANVPASVSHRHGNVTLTLHPRHYANAEISLHSMSGKRVLRTSVSAGGGGGILRQNITPGVYLLSVKGAAGNTFSTRLSHNGGALNVNTVFGNADAPATHSFASSVAEAWTVTATLSIAPGQTSVVTRTFVPVKGRDNDTLRLDFGNDIIQFGDTTDIQLNNTTATASGRNASSVTITQNSTYGTVIEIAANGVYRVQGTLTNGFIAVSQRGISPEIILNGATITSQRYGALVSLKRSNVTLTLAAGTTNSLSCGTSSNSGYTPGYDPEEEPNATIIVRDDLTIRGSGTLNVTPRVNNGIGSRAVLRIEGGNITVNNAPNNALKGNDAIIITGGTLNLTSREDAMKTEEHATDKTRGDITITGGNITIQADQDGIQSARNLTIENATINVTSGVTNNNRGSNANVISTCDDPSSKGIKAVRDILIKSGNIKVSSRDDGIHADGTLTIDGGTIEVATAASSTASKPNCDSGGGTPCIFPGFPAGCVGGGGMQMNSGYGGDALRGQSRLTINNGDINITKSSEGIEAYDVVINGGTIRVTATDDAINSGDTLTCNHQMCCLTWGAITINGGTIYATAGNDVLDSNGDLKITGGTIVAFGPGGSGTVQEAIDVDGSFTVTGGTLIAAGNDGGNMQKSPEANGTTQRVVFFKNQLNLSANQIVSVWSAGNHVVTFRNLNSATRLVVTSPRINTGSMELRTDGTATGTMDDLRMFTGSSGGTVRRTVNIQNMVTTDGQVSQGASCQARPNR